MALTKNRRPLRRAFTLTALMLLLGACRSVPDAPPVAETYALPQAGGGAIHELATRALLRTGTPDAVALVPDARSAMEWRLAMIDSATVSLDAQYFVENSFPTPGYFANFSPTRQSLAV